MRMQKDSGELQKPEKDILSNPSNRTLNEAKSSTTISLIPTGVPDDLIPCRKYRGGAHSAPSITGTCHGRKPGNPPFPVSLFFF
jgi:hypothetical protein